MSEKFSLKWNDFYSNVSKSFSLLRNEDYLHDVTLVSDDHKKVSAHKIVLSACSEYFKEIFKNNQHSHPLLCLDGVSSEDLRNIMDYMYNGEVEIYQENLDRFLNVAQRLKLEGLIGGKEEKEELVNENHNDEFSTESVYNTDIDLSSQNDKKQLKLSMKTVAIKTDDENLINEQVLQYMEECSDGRFRCTVCGKMSNEKAKKSVQKADMKKHMQTHMDGLTYTCSLCQKTFRSKNALSAHKSISHR